MLPSFSRITVSTSVVLWAIALSTIWGQEAPAIRPLLPSVELQQPLPKETRLLIDAASIEGFLERVDGSPPNWSAVHGHDGQDERLYMLNRERDHLRDEQHKVLEVVTFFWDGELSDYDPDTNGYRIAIGPRVTPTRWGLVRFKPVELPSNLIAMPTASMRDLLQHRARTEGKTEIIVAMTGRLVSEESIIYDFAHEEPREGMVMPVIQIEQLDYFLVLPQ